MYNLRFVILFIFYFSPKVQFVVTSFSVPTLTSYSQSQFGQSTSTTIGKLKEIGRYYRHPDSATISYPLVVEQPLGRIDKPLKIAVIGGGLAGITAIYELSRLPDAGKNFDVTLFESDYEHFTSVVLEPLAVETFKKRAGRIFAAQSTGGKSPMKTVYEIGAMRFPEIAGLTWHYANQVYNASYPVDIFPNPGKVPTEFVFGERVDRYMNTNWSDPYSPTKEVFELVKNGIIGNGNNISLFPIDGKDPTEINKELASKSTQPQRLKKIHEAWKEFAKNHDNLSLENAVRKVITERLHELKDVAGLHSNESKINYYVDLFGLYGFGTGGFRPLFHNAFIDVMRLLLWEYQNEYNLPGTENYQFVEKLFDKAKSNGLKVTVTRARVSDVCHLDEGNTTSAVVLFYRINVKTKDPPTCSEKYIVEEEEKCSSDTFDYVILAVPPQQASAIVSRAGFQNAARKVRLGDYRAEYPKLLNVRPPLILNADANADTENSKLFSALNRVHMVVSAKVFATIEKGAYDKWAPRFVNDHIKAVVSDNGLASSYIVPSPNPKENYYTLLLSYTWEDCTRSIQSDLLKYPKNVGCDTDENEEMMKRMIYRAIRDIPNPASNGTNADGRLNYERWWFGQMLKESYENGSLTDFMSYDWSTHHTAGAFKLDLTGDYYNSHLLFRYHTHAYKAKELGNRFFLAGDSYSHLGGWLEGAFMSSINAVCGLIVSANGGNVKALSDQAQIVMESFENVA